MDRSDRHTLVLKFDITGRLRYLSHQETARMLERALVRANAGLCYSMGFNPHPKISLPLPRTVGVVSIGDILCAEVDTEGLDIDRLGDDIRRQLPDECVLAEVDIVEGKVSYQPKTTQYEFYVDRLADKPQLKQKLSEFENLCFTGQEIIIERWSEKKKKHRNIDVTGYIEEVEIEDGKVTVKVKITPDGSVRVEEILALAGLALEDIPQGITRFNTVFEN